MALISFLLSLLWFFTVPLFFIGLLAHTIRRLWEILSAFVRRHARFWSDFLRRSFSRLWFVCTFPLRLVRAAGPRFVSLVLLCRDAATYLARATLDLFSQIRSWLAGAVSAWLSTVLVASYELVFSCARALLSAILDRLSSIFGFSSLVMDPHEAVRQTRNEFTSPLRELREWRAIASSPESARDLIKHLMKVIDVDRITILSLADDKAAAESAWQVATSDLHQAFERVEELEDEARAVVAFMHERSAQIGESSSSDESLIECLRAELRGMRAVAAGDRIKILSLVDEKATAESALQAATSDLREAFERVVELEDQCVRDLAILEEARAIVDFVHERPLVRGESSAARSPQSCTRRPSLERKMGLSCVLELD